VVLCARCWWPTRTTFIRNTCSTRIKPFHPLINLSLTHGALSILSQHTTVNFHRFHSCPKKPHYVAFFDGAILQRSIPCFRPRCCHSTEGRALYCTWPNSSTGTVNTAQCGSSSLTWLPRNLKIAFTFWFTLVYTVTTQYFLRILRHTNFSRARTILIFLMILNVNNKTLCKVLNCINNNTFK